VGTQAGVATGVTFACGDVVAFPGVAAAECYWSGERGLTGDVSDALDLEPGSNVSLVPGVLRRLCDDATERCDCEGPANASSSLALAPDPPLVPDALIEGPTTAGACEGLTLGSSQSTGSGGRAMTYAWNATAAVDEEWAPGLNASTLNATAERNLALKAVVRNANAGTGSPDFTVSSKELVAIAGGGVVGLEVTLLLENFLGGVSEPSEPFLVAIRTDNPPNLQIVGGTIQSTTRPKPLSVRADAIASSCDGRPAADRAVSIQFELSKVLASGALETTGLVSSSKDQRLFKLAAHSLEAATDYVLATTATDESGGANVTSYVSLAVGRAGFERRGRFSEQSRPRRI